MEGASSDQEEEIVYHNGQDLQSWVRNYHLRSIPRAFLLNAFHLTFGTVEALGATLSFGYNTPLNRFTATHLNKGKQLLSEPLDHFIHLVHSQKDDNVDKYSSFSHYFQLEERFFEYQKYALVNKGSFFKRAIVFRAKITTLALKAVIARIIDTAIAPFATIAALLSLGRFDAINRCAILTLQAPGGLVEDLSRCLIVLLPLSPSQANFKPLSHSELHIY